MSSIDTRSQASLPGQVVVQYTQWIRCFPRQTVPQLLLVVLILAGALGLMLGTHTAMSLWPFAVGMVAVGRRLDAKFRKIRDHFLHGCLNPGVVVSVSPCLVAVMTDMSHRSGESWPAIKITPQPLDRTSGPRPKIGDRVATVALYYGSQQRPRWDDFVPIAVPCVSTRREDVTQSLARLEADRPDVWGEMDRALASVPTPTRPGLYWITTEAEQPVPQNPFQQNPFLEPIS